MIYIFIETLDGSGEGNRAELKQFDTRADADKAYKAALEEDKEYGELVSIKMIVGSEVRSFDIREYHEPVGLTDDELRKSAVEDVDDLGNKEGAA